MIVLSQADPAALREGSSDDTIASTFAAREEGLSIAHLPLGFGEAELPSILAPLSGPDVAVLVAHIMPLDRYRALHAALADRGVRLINSPEKRRAVFELDQALPLLGELTAETIAVHGEDEVDAAIDRLGLPVFVKGAVLSFKSKGKAHCRAESRAQARALVRALLEDSYVSRGCALIRRWLPLRSFEVDATDMPLGREHRVFLYRGDVMGHGWYWPFFHDMARLDDSEREAMLSVARAAAARVPAPYVSVDVGQLEDGRWVIIETGDPQFSGLSFIEPRALWRRLAASVGR